MQPSSHDHGQPQAEPEDAPVRLLRSRASRQGAMHPCPYAQCFASSTSALGLQKHIRKHKQPEKKLFVYLCHWNHLVFKTDIVISEHAVIPNVMGKLLLV